MNTNKTDRLIRILKDLESAVLAFSGGADSTFLLKIIQISGIQALAVTASSALMPRSELRGAQETAEACRVTHRIVHTEELLREDFLKNSPGRCFFCKQELYSALSFIASSEGYGAVLDGSNRDDTADYRPGRKAAEHFGVRSPLIEAGFSKKEIRETSRELGLATWNKPSSPCLATRIPYGQRITREALGRIERAEDYIRSLGFREFRVRDHGDTARIEIVEKEISRLLEHKTRRLISETLQALGYHFISLDLDGYRSGSMNRMLEGTNPCKTPNS